MVTKSIPTPVDTFHRKVHFVTVELDAVLLASLEDLANVLLVLLERGAEDKDVFHDTCDI